MIDDLAESQILPPPPGSPDALGCLVRTPDGATLYAYRYARCGLAATVVVRDKAREAFLLVRRDIEPFRGTWSLPGHF